MKLGNRITLNAATLVIIALGVYAYIAVRIRRAELSADLERETQSIGNALQVSLEAAATAGRRIRVAEELERQAESQKMEVIEVSRSGKVAADKPDPPPLADVPRALRAAREAEDLRKLVAAVGKRQHGLWVAYVELAPLEPLHSVPDGGVSESADARPVDAGDATTTDEESPIHAAPIDRGRAGRLRHVQITGQPFGEHIVLDGLPVYALAVPIRDEQENVVAAVDLLRDESEAENTFGETQRDVGITVALVGVVLALLVWLTTRSGISDPLKRLVVGIDEVSHGDVTRVLMRERDDEIGDLAERFNEMTASLREARVETQRGVDVKLALEARLRHSEKLATIGQLAAGIAHEVGTPLNVIGVRARTMEKKAGEARRALADAGTLEGPPHTFPTEVAKNAGIIAAQAARITKIIQQLLDYARKKVAVRAPVNVMQVVKDSVDFLDHQLRASHVEVHLPPFARGLGEQLPDAPVVVGDADQLQQVCLNLCLNAIQAMSDGGAMEIVVTSQRRRKPGLDTAPEDAYVVLEVADRGVGIPAADRERIFEPFYSTKQDGGGTGLGLAVSQGIVKDHDGWIEIDARFDGGTVFRVFLPALGEELIREARSSATGTREVVAGADPAKSTHEPE